jgi:hypothetical protein
LVFPWSANDRKELPKKTLIVNGGELKMAKKLAKPAVQVRCITRTGRAGGIDNDASFQPRANLPMFVICQRNCMLKFSDSSPVPHFLDFLKVTAARQERHGNGMQQC